MKKWSVVAYGALFAAVVLTLECVGARVPILAGGATLGRPYAPAPPFVAFTAPTLPASTPDTTWAMPTTFVNVPASGNLQAALNAATYGQTLVLPAGATFTGNFTLPAKSGSGWIYVVSSNLAALPYGQRVTPAGAVAMTKIVTPNGSPAIQPAATAHHYVFVGIEFTVSTTATNYGVVVLESPSQSTLAAAPHDIRIERDYIHGNAGGNSRRGVLFGGVNEVVLDSYISEIHDVGSDAQAIAGWNAAGPLLVQNSELQGSTENIMFGGADPATPNLIPSDITIRGNHLFKPLTWQSSSYQVKNALEFKNAQRVLVEGNILENTWEAAQTGIAIVITPRNQDGGCLWCAVTDLTIRLNREINTEGGVTLAGTDSDNVSQQTQRVLIQNNILNAIAGPNGGWVNTYFIESKSGPELGAVDATIDHNTGIGTPRGAMVVESGSGNPVKTGTRFTYTNNLVLTGSYGWLNGPASITGYFVSPSITANAVIGGDPAQFAGFAGNFFPASTGAVGFTAYPTNLALTPVSPYHNAGTDGADLGANVAAINAATICALAGACSGTPPPPPPGPDTIPPVVTLTAPLTATVGVAFTLSATATDNVGVVGGITYAPSQTIIPAVPGPLTVTASARDAAGNTGTTAKTISVSATPPPPPGPTACVASPWVIKSQTATSVTLTRTVITPAANGGQACGALTVTKSTPR